MINSCVVAAIHYVPLLQVLLPQHRNWSSGF